MVGFENPHERNNGYSCLCGGWQRKDLIVLNSARKAGMLEESGDTPPY
jgi:hypothetical protein